MPQELRESRPLLLGHRGARFGKTVRENTFAAFDFALAKGCDGFEFDVRLTADSQAVICHDEAVRRGGLRVSESSGRALALPTFEEVLSRYQDAAFLDIELKVPGLEKATARLIGQWPPSRGFVVSSFLPEVLQTLRRLEATFPLGLICETQEQLGSWTELPVEYVIPHRGLAEKDVIAGLKAKGKKIIVWTVNQPAEMKRCARWGVDGIVSDDPATLAASFERTNPRGG